MPSTARPHTGGPPVFARSRNGGLVSHTRALGTRPACAGTQCPGLPGPWDHVITRGRPSVVAARLVVDACAAARLLFVYLGSVSNFVRVRVAEWCGWRFGSTCTQINETRIVLIVQNACLKVGCAAGHGPRHVGPIQVQVLQGITVVAVGGAWRGEVEGERRRERRG